MRYINENIRNHDDTLRGIGSILDWRISRVHTESTCLVNIGGHDLRSITLLLIGIFSGRNYILQAQSQLCSFGYSILLVIMWGHLHFSPDPE